ncbi:MAG: NAD(P)H-dependent oxidoreductase [Candidatus Omnitrophica bacterium]|nr:NAD(P)H-dependent oxidoreductase [Candidatus Omnitrophota bacterium]
MKKILHIIATPRDQESRTLKISRAFLEVLKRKNPDYQIDELNLFEEELPSLTVKTVAGKYTLMSGKSLDAAQKEAWAGVLKHIERFLSADIYVISTPMWNFSIPYVLKHYIDVIFQPSYLFQYTAKGPEGLAKDKKMVVCTSRGGDYSEGTAAERFDYQDPYLKMAFGFVGITDIAFIHAQPMDAAGAEVRDQKLKDAILTASRIAEEI